MNKKISSLIVTALIVSVISVSVYVQTVKAEGPEPEWFETQTVHSEANSRVPTLAVTANGTWLYAYWDRDGSDYDISLSTSYDNGSSWSYDRTWVTDIPGGHPDGSHLDDPYFFVDDLRSRVYFFLVRKTSYSLA